LNKLKKYKGELPNLLFHYENSPGTSTPSKFIHIKVQKTTWWYDWGH